MRTNFLTLWFVAVFAATAAFVVHLKVRAETVRLGYTLGKARREQEKLIEQRRLLSLEAATLRQTERVETVARSVFGMDVAAPPQVIAVDRSTLRRISGRAR